MAPPRKLPDATTLRMLRDKGLRIRDIAEKYDVTEAAVWQALRNANMVKHRTKATDLMPWPQIRREHTGAQIMTHFRMIARQLNDEPLPSADERRLAAFLDMLDRDGLSVAYHPDCPPNPASSLGGFYYVARDEARDRNRMRPWSEEEMAQAS